MAHIAAAYFAADFITGAKSVDADYDAFIAEITGLGEEYLDIYTRAYAK